ncbi:MAG: flagellar hook protein FlgE [Bryobacteraceae bacterium]
MLTSLNTALSGMNADSVGFDVIGNNLANMSTIGYKSSEVSFEDLMTQSMDAGQQIGLGVGAPTTQRQFTQGTVQTTGGAFDVALQGDGFFVVRDSSNQMLYTRAGNFRVDSDGNLQSASGDAVQGWLATDGVVNPTGAIGNITIPVGALNPPSATTKMSLDLNLDANGTVGASSGSWSTPIQVYDSLGNTHTVTMTFTKTAANTWNYQASIPGDDVTAGTSGTPYDVPNASGTLTFDAKGQLTSPAVANSPIPVAITGLADGAADLNINWSLYTDNGASRLSQYATDSANSGVSQDGSGTAQISKVGISDGGMVTVQYSNGDQKIVAQLAVASIRNPVSLVAAGNNNLAATAGTADPSIGASNTGGRGKIVGGALESSNVDMATEFTHLLVLQRGYEASAKVITATDELLQATINLKQ